MGRIYKASCPHCTYQKEFMVGGGLNSCNLDRCARILSSEEQKHIRELKEQNRVEHFDIENHIAECRSCGELNSQIIITIEDKQGNVHTFGNRCKKCNQEASIYPNTIHYQILCPECKTDFLEFIETGLWD